MSTADRDARIDAAIAEFLETGPDPATWLARHADLRLELESFLADRAAFARAAEPVGPLTVGFDDSPATDAPLGVVRYFGDYELLEEVARGGMGVVYKARQVSLNRVVALKMILGGNLATSEDVRRFRAEAEAAALLDHPNIVPIYEVGEHEGHQYFTMKYVDGGTLNSRFETLRRNEQGRTLLRSVANLIATIGRAVQFAHDRGILHRDLKPANVLVDVAGTPLVTDFGLAKRAAADATATRSGLMVGTPAYMAPEQARAERQLTTAADVWSLGAILYEGLTGRPPFKADTLAATLKLVEETEPPRPRVVNPVVDRDLETVVLRCLEKEPGKRYGSAAALADDLDRWRRGEPVVARRVTAVERAIKWARRRPAVAALLAACVVLLVVGTAVSWVLTLDARRARDESAARARESRKLLNSLALEQGWTAEQDGDVFRALLWYAEPLNDPDLDPAEEETVRRRVGMYLRNLSWHQPRLAFNVDEHIGGEVDVTQDGRLVACGTSHREGDVLHGSCQLFDVATGRRVLPPLRQTGGIECLKFSPDGRLLAIAAGFQNLVPSVNHTIRLWDVSTGQPVGPPVVSVEHVYDLTFSPDGQLLVPAVGELYAEADTISEKDWHQRYKDGVDLPVFRVRDGLEPATNLRHPAASCVRHVTFGPGPPAETASGGRLLTVSDGWWRNNKGRSVGFNWTGRVWALGADGSTARILADAPSNYAGLVQTHPTAAVLSPDGRRFVIAAENTAVIWDVVGPPPLLGKDDGRPRPTVWLDHAGLVLSAAFGPDGQTVLTACDDRTVRIWDAQTGRQVRPAIRTSSPPTRAEFDPDDRTVWTSHPAEATCRGWDLATARPISPPLRTGADSASMPGVIRRRDVLLTYDHDTLALIRTDVVDRRPREDLLLLVRLICGLTLRDGRPEPLSADERRAGWERLKARHPAVFTIPVDECVAWHAADGTHGHREKHLALFAANQEVVEYPDRPGGFVFRGEINGLLEHWAEAAADFESAVRLGGGDWVQAAFLRTVETRWNAVRTPQSSKDSAGGALAAAELAQRFAPTDVNALLLGAAQYRTGRFAAAVETLTKLVASQTEPNAQGLAFLAMAHHRLGQADEAKARLTQLRAIPSARDVELTAEAEAVLAGKAK